MKRIKSIGKTVRRILLVFFLLAGIMSVSMELWGICGEIAEKRECIALLDLDLAPEQVERREVYDDHGGLNGDGQALYELSPKEKGGVKSWKECGLALDSWNDLPLEGETAAQVWEKSDAGQLLEWKTGLSEIAHGKWKVVFRGSQDPEWRFYNWSLCIYDSDTDQMYYYESDM